MCGFFSGLWQCSLATLESNLNRLGTSRNTSYSYLTPVNWLLPNNTRRGLCYRRRRVLHISSSSSWELMLLSRSLSNLVFKLYVKHTPLHPTSWPYTLAHTHTHRLVSLEIHDKVDKENIDFAKTKNLHLQHSFGNWSGADLERGLLGRLGHQSCPWTWKHDHTLPMSTTLLSTISWM